MNAAGSKVEARPWGGFRAALFAVGTVIAVTALRETLCLVWSSNGAGEVDPVFGTGGQVGGRPLRLIDGANDDEKDEAAD
jgi:hypothetical protein